MLKLLCLALTMQVKNSCDFFFFNENKAGSVTRLKGNS